MAALLLVAAHLAVQAHTQDVAQATVTRWLKQSGGSVQQVRFHLLRNALTLDGVHFASGGISVDIPEVLLYARVDTLLGGHPRLSRVRMSAPRLHLPLRTALSLLASQPGAGQTMFHQIWRLARHLDIRGGTLVLAGGGADGHATTLDGLSLSVRQHFGSRTVRGSGRYHGAPLTFHSRMHRAHAGVGGEVDLVWDRLDGHDAAPEMLGLAPLDGELSGQAQWTWERPAGGQAHAHLQGEVHLAGPASAMSSLGWHADRTSDGWHAQLAARAWPLAPMRTLAPSWGGRTLAHGAFTGDVVVDWSGRKARRLQVAQGSIRDLDYAPATWSGDVDARPDWHVDRVEMKDVRMDAVTRALSFGHLSLAGGEVRMLSGAVPLPPAGHDWQVEAKGVRVDGLALALVFPDGRSTLRTLPLSGHASWRAGVLQCALSASEAPVSWRISGQGLAPDGGMRLDVKAAGLPLIQLRPVLPFAKPQGTGAAVQLDGRAGATLTVDVHPQAWTASGKVEADDVTVAWQGIRLQAKHLSADLEQVGTGVLVQSISRLQATGWQYQGALQPLTATANPAAGEGGMGFPFRKDIGWRIDSMDWQGGSVSFGRADAVWASDVELQMLGWQPGRMATAKLTGRLDGGQLQAAGSIGRIDGVWSADIKAGVSSARPFFLNDWLQVSGAPRVIRGRWAARFSWRTGAGGLGRGRLRLWLHRWKLESGAFPSDPFLGRTGFAAQDLLHRLHAERMAVVDVGYAGARPGVTWAGLGDALLAKLKRQANADAGKAKPHAPAKPKSEARIRLHGRAGLSHNERVRLRKLWRWLIHDRHLVLDMIPQMERQDLNADLVDTFRHTQDLIVRFMTDRGIPTRRLFPVWPTRADRGRGSLGIRVEVLHP